VIPKSETDAITQYRPFVLKMAKQFVTSGVAKDDLVQEGLLAVATAFRSWREDGGASFLTWIRRPVYFAMMKLVREQARAGGTFRGGDGTKPKRVQILSMDAQSTSERGDSDAGMEGFRPGGLPLHDLVGSFTEPPDPLVMRRLPELVAGLEQRERQVIRLRFEKGLSYAEVGAKLKLSRELVRQIEQGALQRMKAQMSKEDES